MSTWPSPSPITIDQLDSDTDTVTGASGGRSQLDNIAQRVNSILACAASGATLWTDENHGSTSGLDADLLDGIEAAAMGQLAVAAEWAKQQNFNEATLTFATPVVWNMDTHQVCTLTLTNNTTMNAPSNVKPGAVYILIVKNTGAYNITSWNAVFDWEGGSAPNVTSGAGKKDCFTFVADDAGQLLGAQRTDYS